MQNLYLPFSILLYPPKEQQQKLLVRGKECFVYLGN